MSPNDPPIIEGHPLVIELFKGMSNKEIRAACHVAGVEEPTVRSWIRQRRTPRIDLFIALANAIGYDLILNARGKTMGKITLLPRLGGNIDVMKGNTRIGYVDSDMLYGIDGKGYASEIESINHRVEIIPKLTNWRNAQGIG